MSPSSSRGSGGRSGAARSGASRSGSGRSGGGRGTSGRSGNRKRAKLPKVQRVGAYAVIVRDGAAGEEILLSRLADKISKHPLWTLPGGGIDHGEDPRAAVVREVYEEAGVPVEVGWTARIFSSHQSRAWRLGRRVDSHAVRIVYDGWVPLDAPAPRTTEVDGSTAEAAWLPLADVVSGEVPTVALVKDALQDWRPASKQRVAAYALVVDDAAEGPRVLLTRISERGFHSGSWTLPGGGIDLGEEPRAALVREVREECGVECAVGEVIEVDDIRITGTAPDGRHEEFHGVHLVFTATVPAGAEPRVVEVGGTTDDAAWVPVADVEAGRLEVLPVVRAALKAWARRH